MPIPRPAGDRESAAEQAVARNARTALDALDRVESYLRRARILFRSEQAEAPRHPRAVEWFLDNYFLVQRSLRQARRDLPRPFYRQLLGIDASEGVPRVDRLASELLVATRLLPELASIEAYLEERRESAPLTMAELWALPAFLRLGAIEQLVGALHEIFPNEPFPQVAPPRAGRPPRFDEDDRVASCIRTFRVLDEIDWKTFFRQCSEVEGILRRDPEGAYARMDFATQDHYRKVVERLARRTRRDEREVARLAVSAAAAFTAEGGRRAHVGHFLIGEGLPQLERDLGYRLRWGERLRRLLARHPTSVLLGGIALATASAMLAPAAYLAWSDADAWTWLLGLGLALLPASTLGVTVVHWFLTSALPPRILPKLDFARGIPADCRTVVVVPCLLGNAGEVQGLVRQLELHHLRNPDPELRFALLSDFLDAAEPAVPADAELLERAATGIRLLNRKYGTDGHGPFHLFHRERKWNPSEGVWMGWERKRGKLEEFNAFLLGKQDGSGFACHVGAAAALAGIRYVITLDAGTLLPHDSAARLIGTLAHPVNRAEVDPGSGRVLRGYSVLQPRVEISPTRSAESLFTRIFTGDAAIDIYTHAVSDVYQDLWGQGIFVGKGIFDLQAFHASLAGRVPENALVSHDHFEGLHGRVALVTDVILYEDYPPQYLAYARRMHRWMRGDWQLLAWLGGRVRDAQGRKVRNRIPAMGRWILFDNLRRSLLTPGLVLLLAAGWLWLPGSPWLWTLAALLAPAGHVFTGTASSLIQGPRRSRVRPWAAGIFKTLNENLGRWLLHVVFLAHESIVATDAIVRTLLRLAITRRRFLEWRTAEHTAQLLAARGPHALVWSEMLGSPLLACVLLAAVVVGNPAALPAAVPLLLLWAAAPEIARRISKPVAHRPESLGDEERAQLRRLARRTWLFFETFVGPEDQWLPPDNYQEHPRGEIAHRTSPTNIGMFLMSTLSAYDFGYLGVTDLAFRLRNTLETIRRLEHYRGHIFNWYDTRTLEPLPPRYVSTVDSGNLAAALLVVQQVCAEAAAAGSALDERRWDGLLDAVDLLAQAVREVKASDSDFHCEDFLNRVADLRGRVVAVRSRRDRWMATLAQLCGEECAALDRSLMDSLAGLHHGADLDALRDVRLWLDRTHQHLRSMHRDAELLSPALLDSPQAAAVVALADERPELRAAWNDLAAVLSRSKTLAATPAAGVAGFAELTRFESAVAGSGLPEARTGVVRDWCEATRQALESCGSNARQLQDELLGIGVDAENEARAMEFGMLYDADSHLFHIGYNATTGGLDANHYDLLASEARISSYLAIAKGDVPVEHWYYLGRPLTRVEGRTVLFSWGASMFEYLMPSLWMEDGDRTLLAESGVAAVAAQIAHGKRNGIPWGASESGFYSFDAQNNYQYRSFGVPGLGLRRGLSADLVIAPYASVLALGERARSVARNLEAFRARGAVGSYGLYEALDFTPERVPRGREFALVRTYMAHHQGMILAAVDNFLNGKIHVRRFHASSLVQTSELLLHEQLPVGISRDLHSEPPDDSLPVPAQAWRAQGPWKPVAGAEFPQTHLLSNGRMSTSLSDRGSGWLRWKGLALTRWVADPVHGGHGMWIYVRDEDTGRLWSAARNPTGVKSSEEHVLFHPHMVEYQRRDEGLLVRTEVFVAPHDDVEIRHLTLVNETDRPRRVSLTSCAEPVLAGCREDRRHPALSKLFVGAEYLGEHAGQLFERRARSEADRPVVLFHRVLGEAAGFERTGHEADRGRFLGRGRTYARPQALDDGGRLTGSTGHTLDPLLAVQASVELAPFASAKVAFVTIAAASRQAVLEVAARYRTLAAVDWAFQEAEIDAAREAQEFRLEPELLSAVQKLTSLLLHPQPALRAAAAEIESNRLGKPRLWGHGISGDLPILLLKLGDPRETELVAELLQAHRIWRRRGLRADLVVLLMGSTSYSGEDEGRVRHVIGQHRSIDWLNRRGGIFLVHADQIAAEEMRLLGVAARIVLDAARGSLLDQLGTVHAPADPPPDFTPPHPEIGAGPALEVARADELLFDNGLGGFSADGREYVIHLARGARTPAPWCNVLANPDFGCLVSESGLGYTWSGNSSQRRLTPWSDDPVSDPPAEAVYLRDEETGAVWTTTPLPAGGPDACRIHHGAGYTDYHRASHGLVQRMRVFVPRADAVKIVALRVQDVAKRSRRLTMTYYAELVLGEVREECQPCTVHEYDEESGALLARNPWNPDFADRVAFLAASEATHGITVDRAEFLGRDGSMRRPAGLERWGLSGCVEAGVDPCQALMVHLELEPEEERTVWFVFGEGRDREQALEWIRRYRGAAAVAAAFEDLGGFWDAFLGAASVRTPDPAMDLMLNRWLPYQTLASRLEARTGFYQSSGAFGFRDQLQDVMALVHGAPEKARAQIQAAAERQFEAGDVLHWWHPPAGRGVRTRCSDDLLWLPYVTAQYVRATGDRSILLEPIAFLAGEPLGEEESERYGDFAAGRESGSLLEHCRRALDHALRYGAHGLPLIGAGDWNDGMNRVGDKGRGESVWLAWFAIKVLSDFATMLEESGDAAEVEDWRRREQELRAAVEAAAWDGDWYLRAWYDDGTAMGSANSAECRIDLIAQAWSAISGAGSSARVGRALAAADASLVQPEERLVLLLQPPFGTRGDGPDPGYIKSYPPGIRENGGQYSHAAAWLGWAYVAQRDGAKAARIFQLLNPILRTQDADQVQRYRVEPYVMAADVYGVDPHVGRGGWTWYSGAAAWTWRLGVEGILGLQRIGGDLAIDPCIPAHWPGFEAVVRTAECECRIRVENPDSVTCGVAEITLDGEPLAGELVPLRSLRGQHEIRVRLGARRTVAAARTGEAS
ncbi:MAG TPA: glucoamylase family protein [Planctomycetota bacterium]